MKNNHIKRILLILISVLLVFTSILSGCSDSSVAVSGKSSSDISEESLSDLNYVSLNEGFTDVLVTDEKTALEAVASVSDVLGISDVQKELKISNVNTVDGDTYYRMQQYYNDIPVYGKMVVVAADEVGNTTALTANTVTINSSVDNINPSITQEQVNNQITKYAKKNIEESDDFYFKMPNISDCQLYVYQSTENSTSHIVYLVESGFYSFIIDCKSGEVLECVKTIASNESKMCFNGDGSESFEGYYSKSDSEYWAYNEDHNMYVHSYKGTNSHSKYFRKQEFLTSDDAYFGNSDYENKYLYDDCAAYLNNVSQIYDYYYKLLNAKPYNEYHIYLDDGYYSGENAVGGYASDDNGNRVGYMSMGYVTGVRDIDVMAHEFTHIVSMSIIDYGNGKEAGAINEGLSDFFGEIIEGSLNQGTPNWIMQGDNLDVSRNAASPSSANYPENINEKNKSGENYSHAYATIISHAGYLMWNGIDGTENKKIDTNTLAKIWYKAINLMLYEPTFSQCANSVYKAAKTVEGVSDSQMECIVQAFEKVGIEVDDSFGTLRAEPSTKLLVKDVNSQLYGNYHISLIEIASIKNGNLLFNTDETIVVDEDVNNPDGYVLNINQGRYLLIIKDNDANGSQQQYKYTLNILKSISSNDPKEIIIETNYGHTAIDDFTIPNDMVLTLGEIDVIEPETIPMDATGYSIKWTSSDESVATVTPTGAECIVTSKGKGTTTITGELASNGKTMTKSTNVRVASQGRDTVLVLDVSGSMFGTPMDEMKKSAINFCNELLADEYNNRVGLVLYDNYINSIDLTNDLDILIDYIEGISSGGTTNMQEALATAGNMLDSQGKDDNIKNIVVMADGLPNEGETSDTGKMSQLTEYASYPTDVAYANGVINTAENIMYKYNMYSLGFFHDLSGVEKDFAVDLMKLLTNMPDGYHQVDTAENLQFAFGDIQETISDGSKVVINIACPVDVSVTYNGETLSSAQSSYSDTASFGTLQLLGKNKDIKVLSLDPSAVYDIQLNGTGNGTMNYSVNYLDDSDSIIDYRTFESVPITPTTKIDSNTNNSAGDITLNLDEDGDGTVDKVYSAAVNSVAELTYGDESPEEVEVVEETEPVKSDNTWVTVMIAVVVVIVLLGIILTVVLLSSSSKKKNQNYNIPVIEPKIDTENKDGKITVISGSMSGQKFNLEPGKGYIIGKDSSKAQIALSHDYGKVSREHCAISYDSQTQLYSIIDMSSNGTYYIDNKTTRLNSYTSKRKLNKTVSTELQSGCILILGDEDCRIVLN